MSTSDDYTQRAIEQHRELLEGYLTHVPPRVRDGSWNVATEFKKSVAEGRRVLNKRNAKFGELSSAINNLNRYWE